MIVWQTNKKPRKNKPYYKRLLEKLEEGKITEKEYDELNEKHKIELEKKRKYTCGEKINTFEELLDVLDKCGLVWMFGRPMTAGAVVSQQFNTIIHLLYSGNIRKVIKKSNTERNLATAEKSSGVEGEIKWN